MGQVTFDEEVPVTVVVTLAVKPGCDGAFEQWLHAVARDAMSFEGHLGLNVIRPGPGSREYAIIFRYRTRAQLQAWITSDVRARHLEEVKPLCAEPAKVQQLSGLEAWFTIADQPPMKPPPRHKMALVTLVAIFPIVSTLNAFVVPQLSPLHPVVRTFTLCVAIILLMTYAVMPLLTRIFFRWLYPHVG